MKTKLVWNDFKRNKVITITIVLFIAVASLLLSLTSILSINLFGSIDRMMEKAKTPHFLQMHSGNINTRDIEKFFIENEKVENFQIINFLGLDNEDIFINKTSLAGNLQDNGFVTQSGKFDFLMNLDGEIVQPSEGEVYAPLYYKKEGLINIGDTISINGTELKVVGFIRDSQMSSALASSKRFLINENDYKKFESIGKLEYLIEFRIKNLDDLGNFSTDYSTANLPSNGPTITWPLFRMINAISDGIMIALILLVSVLSVLIGMLCIRFTLLSKIEEDYVEIGTLKAIGVRVSDIRSIYLNNYGILAIVGIFIGFILSLTFYNLLLENISLNFGESDNGVLSIIVAGFFQLLIFGIIILYVLTNLKGFKKISPTQAIRFGATGNSKEKSYLKLSDNKFLPINYFLGFSDIINKPRLYFTLFIVVLLSAFIIVIPKNLYNTMSASDFISYMGVGKSDMRIDIQGNENINKNTEEIINYIKDDKDVFKFNLLETKTFSVEHENGALENLKVELGDLSAFPISPIRGKMPEYKEEIAISSLLANEWDKDVGDKILLHINNSKEEMIISGIYSDITNGGKTAKAVFEDKTGKISWNVVLLSFKEDVNIDKKYNEYNDLFQFARVSDIENYIAQTFGQTLDAIKNASVSSVIVATTIIFLISTLFLKLLVVKDRYNIGLIKAMGFTNLDLKKQFASRIIVVMILGIIGGTLLAGTLGEKIVSLAISSFGATGFKFVTDKVFSFVIAPTVLILTSIFAIAISTRKIGDINISQILKE